MFVCLFQVCDTWEAVRALDDAENWAERTRVLSKADHTELIDYAKVLCSSMYMCGDIMTIIVYVLILILQDIIYELVDNLPMYVIFGNCLIQKCVH